MSCLHYLAVTGVFLQREREAAVMVKCEEGKDVFVFYFSRPFFILFFVKTRLRPSGFVSKFIFSAFRGSKSVHSQFCNDSVLKVHYVHLVLSILCCS